PPPFAVFIFGDLACQTGEEEVHKHHYCHDQRRREADVSDRMVCGRRDWAAQFHAVETFCWYGCRHSIGFNGVSLCADLPNYTRTSGWKRNLVILRIGPFAKAL